MKILQINASYKPAYIYGGPTMSVSRLSEELSCGGNIVEVFTTTANGPEELPVKAGKPQIIGGVRVTYFRRVSGDHTHFSPALLFKLRRHVRYFDVVHIHAWWNLVSILSCVIALNRGIPVVISPRGTLSEYSFRNKNNFLKMMLHRVLGKDLLGKSFIHVTSGREKQSIEKLLACKGIFNIPNFVALPHEIPASSDHSREYLKLLFFSRIEQKKGLEILFNALVSVTIAYRLTIAGDGDPAYLEKLKMIAKRNGIDDKIDWIGFQGGEKFDMLAEHDLLVLPSHDENFGNVVIESLSVGTAVLISKNVGLADYVQLHHLGWVVENNSLTLNEMISNMRKYRGDLTRIRQQAPARIRNDFSEENLRQQYLDMYTQIINNG